MYIHFDISLQRMAMHKIALSFWERDDVKGKEREYFCRNKKLKCVTEWLELVKFVLKLTERCESRLPHIIYGELIYCVRDVGNRRYGWFRYLQKCSMMNIRSQRTIYDIYFNDKIFWTHYGTIDEIKTVRNWLESSGTLLAKIYNMACLFCLQDIIESTWNRISTKVRKLKYQDKEIFKKTGVQLIGYWNTHLGYCQANVMQAIRRYSYILNIDYYRDATVNKIFFSICIRKGLRFAVEYFWKLLNEEEKNRLLIPVFSQNLEILFKYRKENQYYRKDLHIETCLFLMNQFTDEMRALLYGNQFISSVTSDQPKSNKRILKMCLVMWPWQELLVPLIQDMWEFLEENDFLNFINNLLDRMLEDHKFGMPIENGLLQRLLRRVWYVTPAKFKQAMDGKVIEKLIDVWDLTNIKMILNDEVMAGKRTELKQVWEELLWKKIREDDKSLHEILSAILILEDNTEIKENMNFVYEYLLREDFGKLSEFCNSKSKEEKEYIKENLHVLQICIYLITKNNFNLVDEFLSWVYDLNGNSIQNVKEKFKTEKFTCEQIFYVWNTSSGNVETAESLSTNFLKWFLKTEDDVAFFKGKIIKGAIENLEVHIYKDFFINAFVVTDNYRMLEPFLRWCLYSQEEINLIVAGVVKEGSNNRCRVYMENNDVKSAQKYFDWAFDSVEKKRNFLFEFMILGDDGNLYSRKLISMPYKSKHDKEEKLEKFKAFIDFWIKPMEETSIKMFKGKLKKWSKGSKAIPGDYDTDNSFFDTEESTTDLFDSESDREGLVNSRDILCKRDSFNMFMSLLNTLDDSEEE